MNGGGQLLFPVHRRGLNGGLSFKIREAPPTTPKCESASSQPRGKTQARLAGDAAREKARRVLLAIQMQTSVLLVLPQAPL